MAEQKIYYEDYEMNHVRLTTGRTITETDFVVHAGHTGDFSRIIWMRNLPRHCRAASALRMAP